MSQTTAVVPPRAAPPAGSVTGRKIIHIDMDAFFASVEQLDDPSLRGRPVAVGGDPNSRGVVAAASYEARAFGVRSAMPMSRAIRRCPGLIRVSPRFDRYIEVSHHIREILGRFTPRVEPASLDEAYLDVTGSERPATEIAAEIKRRIREETGLTASAGAGPSKLVAKIASDAGKPDGLVVVKPSAVRRFLSPLPVGRLWGVGPVTERLLQAAGLRTIGDLADADEALLRERIGPSGPSLSRLARGEDDRPVCTERRTRSISCERTLPVDTRDLPALDGLIARFAGQIHDSLLDEGLKARTVVVKIRYSDFSLTTRSRTLVTPFDEAAVIEREARALLARTMAGRRKVRLIGVAVAGLLGEGEPYQKPLFPARAE